ncbi:MAG: hypothetical protein ACI822_002681 [Gammaproteobacteria bacterium]|jgi:hypothetical protein
MSDKEPTQAVDTDEVESAIQSVEIYTPDREYGGPKGKEPTRYGDWEKNGRCIDF